MFRRREIHLLTCPALIDNSILIAGPLPLYEDSFATFALMVSVEFMMSY